MHGQGAHATIDRTHIAVAYLLITVEGKPATRRPLDGPTIVGRALDCPIWLADDRMSRQHCRFEPSANGAAESWTLIDLNSKNGTIVRGDRISVYKLADGDEIHVGRARLVFHSRSEPPQRPRRRSHRSAARCQTRNVPRHSVTPWSIRDFRCLRSSPRSMSRNLHARKTNRSDRSRSSVRRPHRRCMRLG